MGWPCASLLSAGYDSSPQLRDSLNLCGPPKRIVLHSSRVENDGEGRKSKVRHAAHVEYSSDLIKNVCNFGHTINTLAGRSGLVLSAVGLWAVT